MGPRPRRAAGCAPMAAPAPADPVAAVRGQVPRRRRPRRGPRRRCRSTSTSVGRGSWRRCDGRCGPTRRPAPSCSGVKGEALAAATAANRAVATGDRPVRRSSATPGCSTARSMRRRSIAGRDVGWTDAVLIVSGLWGLVAPDDPIPDYKLKMGCVAAGRSASCRPGGARASTARSAQVLGESTAVAGVEPAAPRARCRVVGHRRTAPCTRCGSSSRAADGQLVAVAALEQVPQGCAGPVPGRAPGCRTRGPGRRGSTRRASCSIPHGPSRQRRSGAARLRATFLSAAHRGRADARRGSAAR